MKEYIVKYETEQIENSTFFYGGKIEHELIRCKDCIFYDPPHVENNGERHEYSDFPPEAFDTILLTENVTIDYGINVGGRCCRDYNAGYTDDKRVFVASDNYCGRAERKGKP